MLAGLFLPSICGANAPVRHDSNADVTAVLLPANICRTFLQFLVRMPTSVLSISKQGAVRMPTTSRVVTPNTFLGSYLPSFFRVSAAMGTVELTGLEMMFSRAYRVMLFIIPPSLEACCIF